MFIGGGSLLLFACKKASGISLITDALKIAGVGLEPHDLRVMSPTSYQLLYPAIMVSVLPVVPVTGIEPVRCFRITGF